MRWTIIGTIAIAAATAAIGDPLTGLLALATMAWLMLAFRPIEAGALVATLSRQRFE